MKITYKVLKDGRAAIIKYAHATKDQFKDEEEMVEFKGSNNPRDLVADAIAKKVREVYPR